MHTCHDEYAGFTFLLWGVRSPFHVDCGVSSVVFDGHSSLYIIYSTMGAHCISPASPHVVEVVSRLVIHYNFVPGMWFREVRKLLKMFDGVGRQSTLSGAPAVEKQTKPVNSDSLQVLVSGARGVPIPSRKRNHQVAEAMYVARFRRTFFLCGFSWGETQLAARVFYLVLVCTWLWPKYIRRYTWFRQQPKT